MARIQVKREIDIKRNVIEQFLMNVKEFIKHKRKLVLIILAVFFGLGILSLVAAVYVDSVTTENRRQYEKIMDKYTKKTEDKKIIEETIKDLEQLVNSSSIGFAHEMSLYSLGNLYFTEKNYSQAKKYLLAFTKKNSSVLSQIALLKAAVAADEMKNTDEALNLLKQLEDKSNLIIADQLYLYEAFIYKKKGDLFQARNYLNKVIASYPRSPFAQKAKKSLLLLTLDKNNKSKK